MNEKSDQIFSPQRYLSVICEAITEERHDGIIYPRDFIKNFFLLNIPLDDNVSLDRFKILDYIGHKFKNSEGITYRIINIRENYRITLDEIFISPKDDIENDCSFKIITKHPDNTITKKIWNVNDPGEGIHFNSKIWDTHKKIYWDWDRKIKSKKSYARSIGNHWGNDPIYRYLRTQYMHLVEIDLDISKFNYSLDQFGEYDLDQHKFEFRTKYWDYKTKPDDNVFYHKISQFFERVWYVPTTKGNDNDED